ncbi:hypothetical protein QA640_40335 [Bradyrhizobium sp. CB82]|uniref:hypothetical protein n=1 Tax=Bradyrhizobium sp. CB82 TaxID=3039159 RepID=UPI0024B11FB9|nr:hypothetical protein [Bradyrhizobium sp. CB82]WFU40358.1 hypothetical protein QA640_40335 [Bradyrhizobium sp. CB82]
MSKISEGGTEAGIDDEIEVRTSRGAPSREIVDADERQPGARPPRAWCHRRTCFR